MSKVTKMKVAPVRIENHFPLTEANNQQSKWDPDNLHRHSDYAPTKKEAVVGQHYDIAQMKRETSLDHDVSGSKPGLTHSTNYSGQIDSRGATDASYRYRGARRRIRELVQTQTVPEDSVLIIVADDFDEVDFSVSHEFNPIDLSLEQSTHFGEPRRAAGMLLQQSRQRLS